MEKPKWKVATGSPTVGGHLRMSSSEMAEVQGLERQENGLGPDSATHTKAETPVCLCRPWPPKPEEKHEAAGRGQHREEETDEPFGETGFLLVRACVRACARAYASVRM